MVVRFIVGVDPDPVLHAGMLDEAAQYGDVLVLDTRDTYSGLTNKTRWVGEARWLVSNIIGRIRVCWAGVRVSGWPGLLRCLAPSSAQLTNMRD